MVINMLASVRRMTLQAKEQPVGDASPFKCDYRNRSRTVPPVLH